MTDDELIDATVREAQLIFAQTSRVWFTGLAPEDEQAVADFQEWCSRRDLHSWFESGLRGCAEEQCRKGRWNRDPELSALSNVQSFLLNVFAIFIYERGKTNSPAEWLFGRGNGVRAMLEKRDAPATTGEAGESI